MIYSYRKGLSEEWYSQGLFWVFSWSTYVFTYFQNNKYYGAFEIVDSVLHLVLLSALNILMLNTTTRSVGMLRPGILINFDDLEMEEQPNPKPSEIVSNRPCWISVIIKPRTKNHPNDNFMILVKNGFLKEKPKPATYQFHRTSTF